VDQSSLLSAIEMQQKCKVQETLHKKDDFIEVYKNLNRRDLRSENNFIGLLK